MIQRRKTMLLAGFLHAGELAAIELVLIDVSPIVGGRVHRETGSDGPIGSDDDVVLTGSTVPFSEVQLAVCILDDSGSFHQPLGNVSIPAAAVTVPAQALQIGTAGHSDESLDFLQALHRIDHLVAGLVFLDQPIHQQIDLPPVLRTNIGWISYRGLKRLGKSTRTTARMLENTR